MKYIIFTLSFILFITLLIQTISSGWNLENFEHGNTSNKMHVYLLCYNEQILLPQTIKHYRTQFPNCQITIYDNESTDNSVNISKEHGCNVVSWKSDGINENKYLDIKNNCWKDSGSEWVIVADMDEWIGANEHDLLYEEQKGSTILMTQGYNMVGESQTEDLSDLDFFNIKKAAPSEDYSKRICFQPKHVKDINYGLGAHKCDPKGTVIFSKTAYHLKHMDYLGIPFVIKKKRDRHARNKINEGKGTGIQYTDDIDTAKKQYNELFKSAVEYVP